MWNRNFWKSKVLCVGLCFLLLFSSLAGCSLGRGNTETDTMDYTDALQREVQIPKHPRRVAALLGSFADIWMLAGGEVCATAEDAWDDFGLELEDVVNLGGAHSPGLEKLFSADPDLVLASASTASNVEMREVLENAGIAVVYFDVDNFSDYLSMLEFCTDITGRKDLYEQNGLRLQEKITAVKTEIESAQFSEKERSILFLRASSGAVKAKGSQGTILGEMLADLGCKNIADSDTSLLETLSVESVIRQEPHHIFVVTMGDDTDKALENLSQLLQENPAWGTLQAVKEERIHVMDRKYFNLKPNGKWAESYEKLGAILLG